MTRRGTLYPRTSERNMIWTLTLVTFPKIHFRTFSRKKNLLGRRRYLTPGYADTPVKNRILKKIVTHPCKIHRWKAEHECGKLVKTFFKSDRFFVKLRPVYDRTTFHQDYDVMIFTAAVPPPPPDAHYFCFTNSFRCEELIYQKWAPHYLLCGK